MSTMARASGLSRFLTLGLAAILLGGWTMTAQSGPPSGHLAEKPGKFVDVTTASGVHFEGQAYHTAKKYLMETMGSGVALFDYDNDGRLDIFLANGAPLSDTAVIIFTTTTATAPLATLLRRPVPAAAGGPLPRRGSIWTTMVGSIWLCCDI